MKIKLTKPVKGRYFTFITLAPESVLDIPDKDAVKMVDQGKAEAVDKPAVKAQVAEPKPKPKKSE
jgi:hypothetical protein